MTPQPRNKKEWVGGGLQLLPIFLWEMSCVVQTHGRLFLYHFLSLLKSKCGSTIACLQKMCTLYSPCLLIFSLLFSDDSIGHMHIPFVVDFSDKNCVCGEGREAITQGGNFFPARHHQHRRREMTCSIGETAVYERFSVPRGRAPTHGRTGHYTPARQSTNCSH